MFLSPHHVAFHCDRLEDVVPTATGSTVRWTWIAGRRFRGIRRL
ncbi:MAG: hypothetical protein JWL76_811 [Thermoleophilia bacterium]|nr:hypothetical protein [Thermoleophilia bacterium]